MRSFRFPPGSDSWVGDLRDSLAFLTRIPVGSSRNPSASSGWAWPLVGGAAGLAAGAGGQLTILFGGSVQFAALVALGLLVAITGGLHEDGLADSFDGMACGSDKDSRLNAMKDSRLGSCGATALILFILARWQGMSELAEDGDLLPALIAACAASRAAMLSVMHLIAPARDDGLSALFGTPTAATALVALFFAAAISIAAVGSSAAIMLAVAALAAAPIALFARAKLGGQTGDILGACQQSAETAAILALAIF